MKKILPLFSYLFHPLFIPLFGTILYFFISNSYLDFQLKIIVLLQVITITILIPVTLFFILKTLGAIDSIMISKASQRKIPLLFQLFLILILLQKSIPLESMPELFYYFLGGLISTFFLFLLLFANVKASIHMMGIIALTVFTTGLSIHFQNNSLYLLAFLFLMNGVIASSRLEMNAHNLKELIIGFFIGLLPQVALLGYWL